MTGGGVFALGIEAASWEAGASAEVEKYFSMTEASVEAAAPAARKTTMTRATPKAASWSWIFPGIRGSFVINLQTLKQSLRPSKRPPKAQKRWFSGS